MARFVTTSTVAVVHLSNRVDQLVGLLDNCNVRQEAMLRRQPNSGKTQIQVPATNAGRRDKTQAGLSQAVGVHVRSTWQLMRRG